MINFTLFDCVTVLSGLVAASSQPQAVIHVDAGATGPGHDGTSWCEAFTDLKDALDEAEAGDVIYVAAGTYLPEVTGLSDTREATFELVEGVTLEGGYAGCGEQDPYRRDLANHRTILSGDLQRNDEGDLDDPSRDDNSYHVVSGHDILESYTILDGFTVRGGNANAAPNPEPGFEPDRNGGGIFVHDAAVVVRNCVFTNNTANRAGGGAYVLLGERQPLFVNCQFTGNWANFGGGLFTNEVDSILTNCTFHGNRALTGGGGVRVVNAGEPSWTNCIFWGNQDSSGMGESAQIEALAASPVLAFSCLQGLMPGGAYDTGTNIGVDPLFVNAAGTDNDDLRLQSGSQCIDAGDNDAVPSEVTLDLNGAPRIVDGNDDGKAIVDMGAYEFQGSCDQPADCADGVFCNGAETCQGGYCGPGIPVICDDSIGCTMDSCSDEAGACVNTPDDLVCNNGAFCDGDEICDPVAGCTDGPDPSCSDGVGCTVDTCNEANDTCTNTADDSACDDGQYCTGIETCDPTNDCQPGTPVDCNDGVSCTIDTCDEANKVCVNTADDSLCDDGLYCSGVETCDPTNDCQASAPVDCDDGIACTADSCDDAADVCVHAPNDALCDDHNPCTDDACAEGSGCSFTPDDSNGCSDELFCNGLETCVGGACQPGADPCDDGVDCTVDSCDEASDTCTNTPDSSLCDDNLYCTGLETCDPLNGCQAGTAVECSHLDDQCNDGVCNDDVDACVKQPANETQPCDDGLYCTVGETCTAGQCDGGLPRDCGDGVGCTVDNCNEDIDECVNTPDDILCDNTEYCDGNEFCDPTLDCQDGLDPCNPELKCDEVNDRCVSCLGDSWCDDGLYCNGLETCNMVDGICQPGAPVDCNDGVDCTVDACDDDIDACTHTSDDSVCSDGLYCTGVETCDLVNDCQPGTPVNCDDQVSCTVDGCDEASDTCTNTADDTLCDDDLYCTGVETCDPLNGCQAGTAVECSHLDDQCNLGVCDDTLDVCVKDPANETQPCDDGEFCTAGETCTAGLCNGGLPRDCGDGIDCTIDTCDDAADTCVHTPQDGLCDDGNPCTDDTCDVTLGCVFVADDSNSCDDALYCNGPEACTTGTCEPGADPCDDAIECTNDGCDEEADACTNIPDDAFCSDGQYCNGQEVCDPQQDCIDGPDPNCDDGIGCTVDACDEANDTCTNTPDDSTCDDGQYCTGIETCEPTNDCQAGTPVDCDDSIGCTADSCDDVADACVHTPNDTLCDDQNPCTDDACAEGSGCSFTPDDSNSCSDGLFCNGLETCVGGACEAGIDPCDDGVGCTVDVCDEASDTCTHTPDDRACDDSLYCTGIETCDPLNDCQAGAPVDCSSLNDQCNVGVCDDTLDACLAEPANENDSCDDDLYCTTGEVCAGGTCGSGAALDCGDGVGCTVDTCDEDIDACVNTPDDSLCDNTLFCDGVEVCDPTLDCQDGSDPCIPVLKCDEQNNRCVLCLGDSWCDDGLYCNGVETCNLVEGVCAPGTPVDCDDSVGCTVDACDEDADACANTPDDASCTDGLYCTGVESCDPLLDCRAGSPVTCDDGVGCTIDSCSDEAGACVYTPDDLACDDGAFCDGVETCDPAQDCQTGDAPCVGTDQPRCREETDECVECLADLDCDDHDVCSGVETCSPNGSCIEWLEPDCNTNGIHDTCEIIDGSSQDCDVNWVPDECDMAACVADPACDDCNNNGVLDSCDVSAGSSQDCNANRVPDECDIARGISEDTDSDGIPDECAPTRHIIYVDASANADNRPLASGTDPGASWAEAFLNLQDALEAAAQAEGEVTEIWVAAGTYRPSKRTDPDVARTATFQLVNGVAIYGGFEGADSIQYPGGETSLEQRNSDPNTNGTILSGDLIGDDVDLLKPQFLLNEPSRSENSFHVLTATGVDNRTILDGFTVTGGQAEGSGGGMFNSLGSPKLANCIFRANAAAHNGGGLITGDGSLELRNCDFIGNFAGDDGGGMYNWWGNAALLNCAWIGNVAKWGGGLSVTGAGALWLTNCRLRSNIASGLGGGIYIRGDADMTLTNCVLTGNLADRGGGVFSQGVGAISLWNCTLVGNTVGYEGGGVCGAVERPRLTNCILWGNVGFFAAGEVAQYCLGVGAPVVDYCCVQDWTGALGGVGNFGADPLMVDLDGLDDLVGTEDDNMRLLAGSPCVNSGTNYAADSRPMAFGLPDEDFEGQPRIQMCRIDLGAYESSHASPAVSDCNNNGTHDDCDVFNGGAQDCNHNHVPDECDSISRGDFDGDDLVQLDDFAAFVACAAGPFHPPTPLPPYCAATCIQAFDVDRDGDIDLSDLAAFEPTCSGLCP